MYCNFKTNIFSWNKNLYLFYCRHPYPQMDTKYFYRFQVPDSHVYDASWTHFSTEKLETYNWNYVDNYILCRGDEDYPLNEV